MLDKIIHTFYPDCYDERTYFTDKLIDFMFKSDSSNIRFYNFGVYLYKDTKIEVTEWDHGPCYNPVEYWEDIHGYEKKHEINCGISRNFSQLGFGINLWIAERIYMLSVILSWNIFCNIHGLHELISSINCIYAIFTLLRLRQVIIYFKFKNKLKTKVINNKNVDIINGI